MVRKPSKVRHLVAKCMELWKSVHYDALASELQERCIGHQTGQSSRQKIDDACFH